MKIKTITTEDKTKKIPKQKKKKTWSPGQGALPGLVDRPSDTVL